MSGPNALATTRRQRYCCCTAPTLTVGATYDTMDPKHMEWMSRQVQNGRFLLCPNGSHRCMWGDQETWMKGVISFIKNVNDLEKGLHQDNL